MKNYYFICEKGLAELWQTGTTDLIALMHGHLDLTKFRTPSEAELAADKSLLLRTLDILDAATSLDDLKSGKEYDIIKTPDDVIGPLQFNFRDGHVYSVRCLREERAAEEATNTVEIPSGNRHLLIPPTTARVRHRRARVVESC